MTREPWIAGRRPTLHPAGSVSGFLDEIHAPEWMRRGLCAQTDPESFFPEKGGTTRDAKRVCQSCPVRTDCLDYALEHQERFGIWGGLSERERRRLTKTIGLPRGTCELSDCELLVPAARGPRSKYCSTEHAQVASQRRFALRTRGELA